jgi:hypothetical protein
MKPDRIRSMAKSVPFHPFNIVTASGGTFPVSHPEAFWLPPDGDVMIVNAKGNEIVMIDVDQVTECVRVVAKKSAKPEN